MQSTICFELHKKVPNRPPKRCIWDWKWERIWDALENVPKNGLKGANGCKIWPTKNWKYEWECKRKNDICDLGALDDTVQGAPDNTSGVPSKGELQYLYIYKDAQEGAPNVALKGTFLIALELHLMVHLKVHLSVQSRTPLRVQLKICLMVYFEIYIKMHKKSTWNLRGDSMLHLNACKILL